MKKHFSYCFISYKHSLRLGEVLNVGLLMVFPADGLILFKWPHSLQRIKCTYFDFEEEQLQAYLKAIKVKTEQITKSIPVWDSNFTEDYFISLIRQEILPEDEGALQFTHVRKSVQYTDDINQIVEDMFFSYFKHYYKPEDLKAQKSVTISQNFDERSILDTFYSLLYGVNPELKSFNLKGKEIKTENASVVFDLQWQNHGLHLVKPVSLDLRTSGAIEDKAHKLHSKLHLLAVEGEDQVKGVTFDIMVAKPRLSSLETPYLKAIKILKESSEKTNVIEESDYESYSRSAVAGIQNS